MPMIGFKDQFVNKILMGTKTQTIRKGRKSPPSLKARELGKPWARWWGYPPAAPGESLILAAGVRTKEYRELAERVCKTVVPISIFVSAMAATNSETERRICNRVMFLNRPYKPGKPDEVLGDSDMIREDFARADGFDSIDAMARWFIDTHGIDPVARRIMDRVFVGWLVTW